MPVSSPLYRRVQQLLEKRMLKRQANQSPLHILIVEDNSFLKNLFCQAFCQTHIIHAAATAEEGWKLYLDKAPSIIFLDIKLPGIDGHALAKKIKQHCASAYVVMVTASDHIEDKEQAMHNHVDGYIVKPFSKKKINSYIERYLESCPPKEQE